MKYICRIDERSSSKKIGNKALNLSRLISIGAKVPDSWTIEGTVDIRLKREQINKDLLEISNILLNNTRFAVRSSSNKEDTVQESNAGMFSSFLNLNKPGDILHKSELVQSSLETITSNAQDYMSVIIQRMVNSAVSGVLIKKDNRVFVSCNFGLAKGIVDGTGGSEEWLLNTDSDELSMEYDNKNVIEIPAMTKVNPLPGDSCSFVIFNKKFTGKSLKNEMSENTLLVETPQVLKDRKCVDEEQLRSIIGKLNEYAAKIGYGDFDCEWTLDQNGELYVLQIRPVIGKTYSSIMVGIGNSMGRDLIGTPIVDGTVTGEIFFAQDMNALHDEEQLKKILVVERLTPQNLKYAREASAILTSSHSILSHTAIVARELNTPTIADVKIDLLKSGQFYKIDGSSGVIKKINKAEILKNDEKIEPEHLDLATNLFFKPWSNQIFGEEW